MIRDVRTCINHVLRGREVDLRSWFDIFVVLFDLFSIQRHKPLTSSFKHLRR